MLLVTYLSYVCASGDRGIRRGEGSSDSSLYSWNTRFRITSKLRPTRKWSNTIVETIKLSFFLLPFRWAEWDQVTLTKVHCHTDVVWMTLLSFEHVSLWCLFFDPHLTTYQTNIGVQFIKVTIYYWWTLFQWHVWLLCSLRIHHWTMSLNARGSKGNFTNTINKKTIRPTSHVVM